jgi:hypothetical protein
MLSADLPLQFSLSTRDLKHLSLSSWAQRS